MPEKINFQPEENINHLLDSDKSPDEVEKAGRDILSTFLYQHQIDEYRKELQQTGIEEDDVTKENNLSLTAEKMQQNFLEFQKAIEGDSRLDFVRVLQGKFPQGKFYIVGGSVRDGLLGKEAKDVDMVITGIADAQLEEILRQLGKKVEKAGRFGVYKFWSEIILDDNNDHPEIDIALPRTEKSGGSGSRKDFIIESDHNLPIGDDLSRRDLTVNALAYDLLTKELVDPFGGKQDILDRNIKAVGNPDERFDEDLSRILRAIRFSIKLNADIDSQTLDSIRKNSQRINDHLETDSDKFVLPRETIQAELNKILLMDPILMIDYFQKAQILDKILPEVAALEHIEQLPNHHSEGNVLNHTKLVLRSLPPKSPLALVYAALFHDLGKTKTASRNETGKITFYGHAEEGTPIVQEICQRLKFDKKITDDIIWLVANHMKVFAGAEMSNKKIHDLFLSDKTRGTMLLQLNKADCRSSVPEREYFDNKHYHALVKKIYSMISEKKDEVKPLITGKDLIGLGLRPGSRFKEILNIMLEKQINGEFETKDVALEVLKNSLQAESEKNSQIKMISRKELEQFFEENNLQRSKSAAKIAMLFGGDRLSCCDELIAIKDLAGKIIGVSSIAPYGEGVNPIMIKIQNEINIPESEKIKPGVPTIVGEFVLPQYRGQGYGKKLMLKSILRCKERGFSKIHIDALSKAITKIIKDLPKEIRDDIELIDSGGILDSWKD